MSSDNRLNRDILETLQDVMEDQFPVLIETFLSDSEDRIRQLQRAIASGEADMVRRQAHSFKGSCHNIGAERLGNLCAGMEQRGRDGELDGLEQLLVEIQNEFSRLKPMLKRFSG
ncbi:Hpt domain-containing protein [Marinimicrobium sp. ARAG 43.8]|uniref:Hpt domain-containing protein n=1 Tax=Marinimicrobium sp. ARAG 43.8 TaxID=3418719 RepID=UPI003CEBADEF